MWGRAEPSLYAVLYSYTVNQINLVGPVSTLSLLLIKVSKNENYHP